MLQYRFANITDAELYYRWANDPSVRGNSFHPDPIAWESHLKWFQKKLGSNDALLYLFFDAKRTPVGQVRVETEQLQGIIDFSVDKNRRGKSYGEMMLKIVTEHYLGKYPENDLKGYVKITNVASQKSFEKAGFKFEKEEVMSGILCKVYIGNGLRLHS